MRKGNIESATAKNLLNLERHPDRIFSLSDLGLHGSEADRFRAFFLKKEKGHGKYSFCKEKILARGYNTVKDMVLTEGCIPTRLLDFHIYGQRYRTAAELAEVDRDMMRNLKRLTMLNFPETLI
jgi:hypothetical protein